MPDRESGRLYSEEEVAAILRRSAKLQAEINESPGTGLTLAELKHIAAEVGIDPMHVESASREVDRGAKDGGETARSLFLPLESHESHILRGEVRDDGWEDVLADIRTFYGEFGTPGQVGNQLSWTRGRFPEPEMQVSVSSRNGRTRVSAHSDYSNLLAFFFPGMVGTSAVVAALTIETLALSPGAVVLALGVWLAIYYFFARTVLVNLNRKERRRARKLTDRIEMSLETGKVVRTPGRPATVELPEDESTPGRSEVEVRGRSRA